MKILLIVLTCLYSNILIAAEEEFTFLQPKDISWLSPEIINSLQADQCLIPRWGFVFGGITTGEFAQAGQIDIAVICRYNDKSEIRIFWGGPNSCSSRIESRGEFIDTVDKRYIVDHYYEYPGGISLPEIDHQAINDHYIEKSSIVKYCQNGNWIELPGAD